MRACSLGIAALACLLAAPALADTVYYEMVPVGDPGNANDTYGGVGRVNYSYQIGKHDVTIAQYTRFLNEVARFDPFLLYNESMATDLNIAGISQSGSIGSYSYSVIGNGNRPITYVSWFDAARFANWMANGQPVGMQEISTTEDGAYDLTLGSGGTAPARNTINPNTGLPPTFYIPTQNEWYKAAYYSPVKGGVGSPGYYDYATQSDSAPGNQIGPSANQANWNNGVYSVTQSSSYDFTQNYLTEVGAFTNSSSFYGTYDQSGNVNQWNDLDGASGSSRGFRGGFWLEQDPESLSYFVDYSDVPSYAGSDVGFRLAGPASAPVPEIDPSSFGSACALLIGSLGMVERRSRRAKRLGTAA